MTENEIKTKPRELFISNTHEYFWPSQIFFLSKLVLCCSWNQFWNPRETWDTYRQVKKEAVAVTVQCVLNSSNWGPIYTSGQTDITLTMADVSRKDRFYCRLFYVGSDAIGVSCSGSQVGSCSLTRQDSLLYYGGGWLVEAGLCSLLRAWFPYCSQSFIPNQRILIRCKENIDPFWRALKMPHINKYDWNIYLSFLLPHLLNISI